MLTPYSSHSLKVPNLWGNPSHPITTRGDLSSAVAREISRSKRPGASENTCQPEYEPNSLIDQISLTPSDDEFLPSTTHSISSRFRRKVASTDLSTLEFQDEAGHGNWFGADDHGQGCTMRSITTILEIEEKLIFFSKECGEDTAVERTRKDVKIYLEMACGIKPAENAFTSAIGE